MPDFSQSVSDFSQSWTAEILKQQPLIAPAAQYVYPQALAEDEGAREDSAATALHVTITPTAGSPFLAVFARGFAEPNLPHGIFPCPHPDWLCAASGGYVYLIDTRNPRSWQQLPFRPVVEIRSAPAQNLLLFAGFTSILAWGKSSIAWTSPKLSDEGLRLTEIHADHLHGFGWDMRTDQETPFTLDLLTGRLIAPQSQRS